MSLTNSVASPTSAVTAEILVVEDAPADLRLLTQILGQAGFGVRVAQTGETALQSVSLRCPDLILLDITLPDVSGYDICTQLRGEAASAEVPIIFLSGLAHVADKVKAFEYGGTDYITKPYQAEELLARIRRHLDHRCTQQALERQNQQLRQQEDLIRANLRQEKAIAHITDQIHRSLDAQKIFETTAQTLRQLLGCDRVLIYRVHLDWKGQIVAEATEETQPLATDLWHQLETRAGSAKAVILQAVIDELAVDPSPNVEPKAPVGRQGQTVENIAQAKLAPEYRHFLEQLQVAAYRTVPIAVGNGFWGVLGAYDHYPSQHWAKGDAAILAETAFQLGIALEQVELLRLVQQKSLELESAQAAVQAASQTKRAFLANMSHELCTPLNAILGYAQVMSRDNTLKDPHQSQLQVIQQNGERLLSLINSVLDLANLEAGHVETRQDQFALNDLLQSVNQLFQSRADAKGLRLQLRLAPNLPGRVVTDLEKLRQILINLLDNAVKFSLQGTITLQVWTEDIDIPPSAPVGKAAILLRFAVTTMVSSISPEEQQRFFEAFDQHVLTQVGISGTGLGLAMSRRLVELLQGWLVLETTPEQGSRFEFSIPVEVVTSPLENNGAFQQVSGLVPEHTGYRVLVVDDTYINRRIITRLFQATQFEVAEAETGEAAIRAWQTLKPQLILMDMRMPVLDGYEATRTIRQMEQAGVDAPAMSTKIIAVTAATFAEEQQAAIAAGCDAVLTKPIQSEQLFTQVSQLLQVPCQYAPVSKSPAVPEPGVLTAADFAAVSTEWLQQVYRAALLCDDRQVQQLLETLPEDAEPLKRVLYVYVQGLQLTRLIEVIEPYVEADPVL